MTMADWRFFASSGESRLACRVGAHYIRDLGWETHPCRLLSPVGSYDRVTGFRVAEVLDGKERSI